MAWRFKASKYKNSTPIVPKPELCIRDIVVGSYQTFGNNIAASASCMAFPWEHTGSSIAVLPIDDCGRKSKTMPLLHAHSDTVTDLHFSPFHDGLLATASQDGLVKIWHIPEGGLKESLLDAECTFSHRQKRVETVGFHPTADCLVHSTSAGTIILHDLTTEKEIFCNNEHPDTIQSLSWKQDGTTMATNTKDKKVRVVDPRSNNPIVMQAESHQSIKDSRVVWLGTQDRILTTGFDANRIRQIMIRDIRNFNAPEKVLDLDCSTGILMPLFDMDTNMLFVAGKGDTTISFLEITDRDPFLVEGIRHSGEQTKGACLLPKRALRVMEGEVNRVLQLTSSMVIPIMYQVPRKTYRDFHSDIFPDTNGYKSDLSPKDWLAGKNLPVSKISLDPVKRQEGEKPIIVLRGNLKEVVSNLNNSNKNKIEIDIKPKVITKPTFAPMKDKIQLMEKDQAKSKIESEEFIQKHKSIMSQKLIENCDNEPKLSAETEKEKNGNGHDLNGHEDTTKNEKINTEVPPKPLPRKSISDQGSFDENSSVVFPKPRPRTACPTSYKTRLGPKPFSTESAEVSFDKVFAVPTAPTTEINETEVNVEEPVDPPCFDDPIEEPETIVEEPPVEKDEVIVEDETIDDPTSDPIEIQKRSSIADRRKLYENRSLSLIEEKKKMSAAIGRGESLKDPEDNRKDRVDSKTNSTHTNGSKANAISKRTSTVFGKVSKFRHLKGTTGHKSTHIENVKNINRQISGECDGVHANPDRVAVPLSGSGGKIAVFEFKTPGRLPDGVIPSLVNGSNIMDFQWNPFDNKQLVVACDDGTIKIWDIPEGGLKESTNEPSRELYAHMEKVHFIRFHPLAKDVFLTASYDMTIKIWDLNTLEMKQCLKGHTDQIFSFAWSSCGTFGATVCKDGKIRIFDVRKSDQPIREGIGGPVGTRGARISYVLEDEYLAVTGFDKVSERQIYIMKVDNLDRQIGMVGLDVSPAILVPFYDEDSSTLFLTGRGDTTIYAYEVTDEAPYFCPLSHHRCSSLHQGLSFLPKNQCDVRNVEFAKCYRLTSNSIEPLSFTVPRLKTELFQDDLFPPTRVTWSATLSAADWFNNVNKKPLRLSLQPEGMDCLSSVTAVVAPAPQVTKFENSDNINYATTQMSPEHLKAKTDALQKSVSARVQLNYELEQDTMEGVDQTEWDE